jgi:RNA-directed DNA polymerase
LKLYTEAKDDRKKRFGDLKKLLFKDEILYAAWNDIRQNTKAPGVDSLTVNIVEESGVADFLKAVKAELKENRYSADLIRSMTIPKKHGGERQIGILTVKDRLVQAAIKLILEPIFEADFDETSFGYRAGKSTKLASLEVYKWLESGNDHIFKSDISKCFDSIPHKKLMVSLKNRINDGFIISMIGSWLAAGKMGSEAVDYPEKGVTQGGIISPLLVNIYLDQFDNRWLEVGLKSLNDDFRGHLVRYSDDFVILSKKKIDFDYVQGMLTELELGLSKDKTHMITARDGFEFLGFYFIETFPDSKYKGRIRIFPSETSIQKVVRCIQESADVNQRDYLPLSDAIQNMMKVIDPWLNYYHHTDYFSGINRIQHCFNDCTQKYITNLSAGKCQNDLTKYLYEDVSLLSERV